MAAAIVNTRLIFICKEIKMNKNTINISDENWLNDAFFNEQQAKLPHDAPKAALTYRVSTKDQVDHNDIPMQKIECRKFAQMHGWRVVLEKQEQGVSGSKVSATKRDAIQELKNEATKGTFEILLVYMFDRLGRIDSETPFVLEWFVKNGIEMWSTHEGQQRIDTHGDKLMNYIRFWHAAGESEKISMRVRDRMRQIVSSGHYTGGKVPLGYMAVHRGRLNKKDQPVKDLVINPDEADLIREIFEKVAFEGASGYALANLFNERGLKSRGGAKYQSNHILRIIRNEIYKGYIVTKHARSEFIPELKIIDDALFEKANEMTERRSVTLNEQKAIAHTYTNTNLLAGLVYCGTCGAKMSAFVHADRYKLSSGETREKIQPKYNCYQRAQRLRDCDGQALYKADIVDSIVLSVARDIFKNIKQTPYNESIEQKLKQESDVIAKKKQAADKRVKTAKYALEKYEGEVLKSIEGKSEFSQDMLSRIIRKAEVELREARLELAELMKSKDDEKVTRQKIRSFYDDFLGWADEFELANVKRKRTILSDLFSKIEVERNYKVTLHLNLTYSQFLQYQNGEDKKQIHVQLETSIAKQDELMGKVGA